MKRQGLDKLMQAVAELSWRQCKLVRDRIDALQAREASTQAIESHELSSCPHCGGAHIVKNGIARDPQQRFLCRSCQRTFNALSGTPLGRLHQRHKWLQYTQALSEGLSIPQVARRLDGALGNVQFAGSLIEREAFAQGLNVGNPFVAQVKSGQKGATQEGVEGACALAALVALRPTGRAVLDDGRAAAVWADGGCCHARLDDLTGQGVRVQRCKGRLDLLVLVVREFERAIDQIRLVSRCLVAHLLKEALWRLMQKMEAGVGFERCITVIR